MQLMPFLLLLLHYDKAQLLLGKIRLPGRNEPLKSEKNILQSWGFWFFFQKQEFHWSLVLQSNFKKDQKHTDLQTVCIHTTC